MLLLISISRVGCVLCRSISVLFVVSARVRVCVCVIVRAHFAKLFKLAQQVIE